MLHLIILPLPCLLHEEQQGISEEVINQTYFCVFMAVASCFPKSKKNLTMEQEIDFDVIIIGGSYAGLSAAMALGRSLRHVLIIDSGMPCNRQAPHAHNFITQDGNTPRQISQKAKRQVLRYDTVRFHKGLATSGIRTGNGFEIRTERGETFRSKKLLFATGVVDLLPPVKGFSECWGISLLHCPYCHGYEVRQEKIGLWGNGEEGYEFCKLISNWSKDLILFTNGKSTLTDEQIEKIRANNTRIIEIPVAELEHQGGRIQFVLLEDGSRQKVSAMFARAAFRQHCDIPRQLGCLLTDQGFIKIDELQKTTIPGVFAAGDNATPLRAVSLATAAGTKAGALINKELIDESY